MWLNMHAADWGGVAQLLDKKHDDAHNDAHAQEASILLHSLKHTLLGLHANLLLS